MESVERANITVVSELDTTQEKYVHKFQKPYIYENKTYEELVFDFEKLRGEDLVAIENEMTSLGEIALSPEISTAYLYRLAARAAGVGSDVILQLPAKEFGRIKNKARDFLISLGF